MKTIDTSMNISTPIIGSSNSQSSNIYQYVYNVELADKKNATNLTENVDRQLEELKLIRDELKSLSQSSCTSFQLGNSLEVNNHEYADFEEKIAKLSSPSNIKSYRPSGKCPHINCYVCTMDGECESSIWYIAEFCEKCYLKHQSPFKICSDPISYFTTLKSVWKNTFAPCNLIFYHFLYLPQAELYLLF